MESIFEFNNLRFSPEMFCHISVIKDDCCVVAYGCLFLPEHLQVSGGGANRKLMPKVQHSLQCLKIHSGNKPENASLPPIQPDRA